MRALKWNDFVDICKRNKPRQNKPPDWENVKSEIASTLNIENDDLLSKKIVGLREKYNRFMKTAKEQSSASRSASLNETVLNSNDFTQISMEPVKKRKTKSLDQLGVKQLKNRTDELWTEIKTYMLRKVKKQIYVFWLYY